MNGKKMKTDKEKKEIKAFIKESNKRVKKNNGNARKSSQNFSDIMKRLNKIV